MDKLARAILPIILILGLVLAGCSSGFESLVARVGEPGPDFELEDLRGQTISLRNLRGSPVMLNFWATWCPACRAEMPYLQQTYEEWSDKGLVLLAINIGESRATIEQFMLSNNLSLPVLLDIREVVARKYNITAIPTTLFIDKDGIIQEKIIGAFPNKEAIEKHLGKIIP